MVVNTSTSCNAILPFNRAVDFFQLNAMPLMLDLVIAPSSVKNLSPFQYFRIISCTIDWIHIKTVAWILHKTKRFADVFLTVEHTDIPACEGASSYINFSDVTDFCCKVPIIFEKKNLPIGKGRSQRNAIWIGAIPINHVISEGP